MSKHLREATIDHLNDLIDFYRETTPRDVREAVMVELHTRALVLHERAMGVTYECQACGEDVAILVQPAHADLHTTEQTAFDAPLDEVNPIAEAFTSEQEGRVAPSEIYVYMCSTCGDQNDFAKFRHNNPAGRKCKGEIYLATYAFVREIVLETI